MLPSGWTVQTLEDLATVQRGRFSPRPRNDSRYYGGHMPFVQTGDVTLAGKYLTEFSQTLNDKGVSVSKVFPRNSILITIAANIGHTAITTFDVACPDSVVGIQAKNGQCDILWLKDVLETKREELDGLSTQNAQKNINLEVLKPLKIITPPINEQRKIADILSIWDRAIAVQEQLIANARAQKKAMMQLLLTQKKRLPGFSERWSFHTFSELADLECRRIDPTSLTEKVNCIELEHIEARTGALIGFCDAREQESLKSVFEPGYILYGKLRPYLRKYYRPDFSGVCSTEIWPLKVNRLLCTPDFLYYLIQSSIFERAVDVSSGSKMPRADWKIVQGSEFQIPDREEQKAICALLNVAERKMSLSQRHLDQLIQEKSALMQELLAGKRRVKTEETV